MDIHDVINAVLQGSQAGSGAPLSSAAASGPSPVISHQKQPASPSQPTPAQPAAASGDILGSILGSVLGSRGQTNAGQTNPPRVPASGGVLGGQTTTPSGSGAAGGFPWGDIMGTMMGAGLGSVAANTVLAPIINQVAQRFNIPPRIAQMVVAFAIAQLIQGHMQGGTGQTKNGNFQVHEVVNSMGAPGGISDTYLTQTGMPHELADKTGLDVPTSTQALQYTFNALGSHLNG